MKWKPNLLVVGLADIVAARRFARNSLADMLAVELDASASKLDASSDAFGVPGIGSGGIFSLLLPSSS